MFHLSCDYELGTELEVDGCGVCVYCGCVRGSDVLIFLVE